MNDTITLSITEYKQLRRALKTLLNYARDAYDLAEFEQSDDLKCAIRIADQAISEDKHNG